MVAIYRVSGKTKMGDSFVKFNIDVIAENEEDAREQTYSILGSRHKVKRFHIKIEGVKKISPEEVKDPRIAFKYELLTKGMRANA